MQKDKYGLPVIMIGIEKICLPEKEQAKAYPVDVIDEMANEILTGGWPTGNELGVIAKENAYEVSASYSWFRAAVKSGITEIPCVIIE